MGPHIVPLVRYGPMTGSHVSGRLPPRHVRLPLARGPLPVFYRSEAERLASFSWQIKTRHVEPSDRLSCLSTRSFERRNTYVGHGWQRWKPTYWGPSFRESARDRSRDPICSTRGGFLLNPALPRARSYKGMRPCRLPRRLGT